MSVCIFTVPLKESNIPHPMLGYLVYHMIVPSHVLRSMLVPNHCVVPVLGDGGEDGGEDVDMVLSLRKLIIIFLINKKANKFNFRLQARGEHP